MSKRTRIDEPAPDADRCKLCGRALKDLVLVIRGREIIIRHCPACAPDPLLLLRGR